jgi:AcrR family transcriptional regulator
MPTPTPTESTTPPTTSRVRGPRPARAGDTSLDRTQIINSAMTLTREEGLHGWSMRRLAATLGVTTMAIYYYFSGRDALVDAITEEVFAQIEVPTEEDAELRWDDRLRAFAWAVHDVLVAYPGVADQIYTHQRFPPSAVPLVDYGVRTLQSAGFDDDAASEAFDVLASVVITRTHFEAAQRLVADLEVSPLDERIQQGWRRLDSAVGDQTAVRSYLGHLDRSHVGASVFARAIDVVLHGLAAELAARPTTP